MNESICFEFEAIFQSGCNFSKWDNGGKIMRNDLNKEFLLISPKEEINEFIQNNENTLGILEAIKP